MCSDHPPSSGTRLGRCVLPENSTPCNPQPQRIEKRGPRSPPPILRSLSFQESKCPNLTTTPGRAEQDSPEPNGWQGEGSTTPPPHSTPMGEGSEGPTTLPQGYNASKAQVRGRHPPTPNLRPIHTRPISKFPAARSAVKPPRGPRAGDVKSGGAFPLSRT